MKLMVNGYGESIKAEAESYDAQEADRFFDVLVASRQYETVEIYNPATAETIKLWTASAGVLVF